MIKRIKIRGFRSLDVDFELGPLTVLVGKSGTGKTNFAEAIDFLRRFLVNSQEPGFLGVSLSSSNIIPFMPTDELDYTVTFGLGEDTDYYVYELSISLAQNQQFIQTERLTTGKSNVVLEFKNAKPSSQGMIHHQKQMTPQLGFGQHNPDTSLAFEFLTTGIGCYDFPGDVLLPPQAGQQVVHHPQRAVPGLVANGANYLEVFISIVSNLEESENVNDITASLRRLNPSIHSLVLNNPVRDRITVIHDLGRTVKLELRHESEGFRRYFAQLLALYQQPRKQVLLFEEPEKGIHPGALGNLADEYEQYTSSGRCQIILTTHSPELLDHFDEDSIRVVEMVNGITKIAPLGPGQAEAIKQELLRPGELLTVTPADSETTE